MGYYTTARGGITVTPKLTVRKAEALEKEFQDEFWVDGLDEIRFPESEWKAYSYDDDVKALLNYLPRHQFTGTVEMDGEENGDRWDLIFEGRKVYRQDYKFVEDGPRKELV